MRDSGDPPSRVFHPVRLGKVSALVVALAAVGVGRSANAESVAIEEVTGPKAAQPSKVEAGILAALGAHGLDVKASKDLAAARKKKKTASSIDVARSLGATHLIRATVSKKKGYRVDAKLIRVADAKVIEKIERTYVKPVQADSVGRGIGETFGTALRATPSPRVEESAPAPKDVPIATETLPTAAPSEAPMPAASRETDADARALSPEASLFRLFVGGGSQIATAYAVIVGDFATGLSHRVSPAPSIAGRVETTIPRVGVEAGVDVSYAWVGYVLDVTPAVSPSDPKGSFLHLGVDARYPIRLLRFGTDGALSLVPIIAFSFDDHAVAAQLPDSIVVGSTATSLLAGTVVRAALDDALVFEAKAQGGAVLSYAETPVATGDPKLGLGLRFGAGARYWLTKRIGAFLDASYDYHRIDFAGSSARARFDSDPAIADATVAESRLSAVAGVAIVAL